MSDEREQRLRDARADALIDAANVLSTFTVGAVAETVRHWLILRARCERLGIVDEVVS